MQEIEDYKQEIADELEAVGVKIYPNGIRKYEPPYVQLYPAQDYIQIVRTSVGTNEYNISVTFNLSIIAGAEDRDSSLGHLNSLISKCLKVVRNLNDVQVTSFVAVDQNGGRLLAANIAFSNEINIYEGDL
ncbi:hypothetical protein RhoFasSB10_02311 [Rhodococcus fascians]|uniref:hypothetical protein n=1 Tax=Rhodococcoides fascians TaxID=1828 RepID=UPI001427E2BA|nr:hypothetical protein [Rhodococcus fascians]